jgi:hypothetical protein
VSQRLNALADAEGINREIRVLAGEAAAMLP